jgi:PIN domain
VEQPARPANPPAVGPTSIGSAPSAPIGSATRGPAIELAVLDAPVLVRGVLTMVLLHVAEAGAFDPVWSDQIHADWARELQRSHPAMPVERLRHRRVEMDRAFPVANVIASRDMQDEVLAHCTTPAERKSAHVLATALSARAAVIITDTSFCLTEVMSKLWHDTAVLSPDAWCLELLDRHEAAVLEGGRSHRASLRHGDGSVDAWLALLRTPQVGLAATADRLATLRGKL